MIMDDIHDISVTETKLKDTILALQQEIAELRDAVAWLKGPEGWYSGHPADTLLAVYRREKRVEKNVKTET